jgi:hypothetical protein
MMQFRSYYYYTSEWWISASERLITTISVLWMNERNRKGAMADAAMIPKDACSISVFALDWQNERRPDTMRVVHAPISLALASTSSTLLEYSLVEVLS